MDKTMVVDRSGSPNPGHGVGLHTRLARFAPVGLWVVQVVYGVFFVGSGFGKILLLDDSLYARAPEAVSWYAVIPQPLIVFIGVCEVLGGFGVLLPAVSRVTPVLVPAAAAGLTVVMILATGFHLTRGEWNLALVTVGLALVGLLTALARWRWAPIVGAPLTRERAVWTLVLLVLVVMVILAPTWYVTTHAQFGQ